MQVVNAGDFASYAQDDVVQEVNNTTALGTSTTTIAANTVAVAANTTALAATVNTDSSALIPLAAQAAGTLHSADQTNLHGRGVKVVFDVTVATTTSAVLTVEGKDAASGKYYTLLTSAAVTSTGTNVYVVYPGVTVASNVAVSGPLPKVWRVSLVVSDNAGTSALTATIGASVII